MSDYPIHAGRILSAADHAAQQAAQSASETALRRADALIEDAQARAHRLIEEAEGRAQAREAELARLSDETLSAFVDERAVDELANAVILVLREVARIRTDFDALSPWLGTLLGAGLERIVGRLPPDEMWTGLLDEALGEMRDRWDLVLRCHPSEAERLGALIARAPTLARSIREVQPDRELEPGGCVLVGARGLLDVGVATQLAAVVRAVETLGAEEVASGGGGDPETLAAGAA